MTGRGFEKALAWLDKASRDWDTPIIDLMAQTTGDPFRLLIGTMLSARTKDRVTAAACKRLFARAPTARRMLKLSEKEVSDLIYPVGFFRTKAPRVLEVCRILVDEYKGRVPDTREELMRLPGVGRKTANLVLATGFGRDSICVDVHVHRISNRLGVVKTKEPLETELALARKVRPELYSDINRLLVAFGQTVCLPVKPRCGLCRIEGCPSRNSEFGD